MAEKTKPKRSGVFVAFSPIEMAALDAALAAISKVAIPVSRGMYLKHAALEFARLRRIEVALTELSKGDRTASSWARQVLAENPR